MFGLMGVARMAGQPGGAFSPLSLFRNGEQGSWYDPSDFSSMFQDSAGTTPVTVGDPVGRILDKSQGMSIGPELVSNGDFSAGTTGWTSNNASIAVSSGQLTATVTTGTFFTVTTDITTVAGRTYVFTVTLVSKTTTSPYAYIRVSLDANEGVQGFNAPATYVCYMVAGVTGTTTLQIKGTSLDTSGDTWTIDNFSAKEIAGNHATQATAAARPVVSAPSYINYDGIDDLLATTFPNLGSACTIARAVPGVGASILTGQTIGAGVRNDSTNHAGLVIIDRALTAGETAALTAYLNGKAGV